MYIALNLKYITADWPFQIAPYSGGSELLSATRFHGPTWIWPQNYISITSAICVQFTQAANTQIHRPCYIQHS